VRIVVEELSVRGRDLAVSPEDAWALAAASSALEGEVVSLSGKLHIDRTPQGVAVDVSVVAEADRICDRCGQPNRLRVAADERLSYVPAGRPTAAEGRQVNQSEADDELEEEELDIGWFHDGELIPGDVLSEALALNLPARVVCEDVASCDAAMKQSVSGDLASTHPFSVLTKARPGSSR